MSDRPSVGVLHTPLTLVSLPLFFLTFALPIVAKNLGASAFEIGGLFTVFTAVVLVVRPLVGIGLDHYGRKPFIIAALCIYGLASFVLSRVFMLEPGNELLGLYGARVLQGLGTALLIITVDTITSDLTTPEKRAAAMGRVSEKQNQGGAWGIFLWFAIASASPAPWPIAFMAYGAAAIWGALLLWRNLPETRPAHVPPHETGRTTRPPLDPLLKRLMGITFFTAFAQALIAPVYLIYLQDRFTSDINTLAWAFFPAAVVAMFLPSRLGKLSDRFGRVPLMAIGVAIAGGLYVSLPVLPSLTWWIAVYTLSSIGWAMSGPAWTAMVGDLTHENHRGRSFGIYQIFSGVGAATGPLVGGWIYDVVAREAPFYLNGFILLLAVPAILLMLRKSK